MHPNAILKLCRTALSQWLADRAPQLAAALAYYAVFSLAPLLVLALAMAGTFLGEAAARGQIVGQVQALVGPESARLLVNVLEGARPPEPGSWASALSALVLLFGASGVFAQLQDALNTIWLEQSQPQRGIVGFIGKRLLSFVMVVLVGLLVLLSLLLSAAISALSQLEGQSLLGWDLLWLWRALSFLLDFAIVTLLFATIYKFLPDVRIAWSDVGVGAVLTAVLFTLGKALLGLYLETSGFGSAYGAAGALVVLLAWVNYSAQIFLLGAEFTQAYATRYGSQIVPSDARGRLQSLARRWPRS